MGLERQVGRDDGEDGRHPVVRDRPVGVDRANDLGGGGIEQDFLMEDLAAFTNDLHGYLMSNGAVKPVGVGGPPKGGTPTRAAPAPSEPVRTPTPAK